MYVHVFWEGLPTVGWTSIDGENAFRVVQTLP